MKKRFSVEILKTMFAVLYIATLTYLLIYFLRSSGLYSILKLEKIKKIEIAKATNEE